MDTKKIASIVVLTMVVLVTGSMIVAAVPQIPEAYWGYAVLDDKPAPIGTPITVEVYGTGEIVGTSTVKYNNGGYVMKVLFDDPDTLKDEGANNGDPLTWKLNGIECSTPAPGTDTAISGKANSNFPLVAHHSDESDTTPPTVTAELIPIKTEEDEGTFK